MAGKGHLTRTVHDGQMRMPKEFFLIRVVLRDVLQRWESLGENLQRWCRQAARGTREQAWGEPTVSFRMVHSRGRVNVKGLFRRSV
jgi:hypothetical protein